MYNPDQEYQNMLQKLKMICRQKRISQYALAKATGMSTSSISSIMSGRTKPYIYTLLMICDALGVSIHELFAHEDTGIDPEEALMLRLYRQLPKEKQGQLKRYADMLYQYKGEL